jgi:PhnB protein
MPSKVKPVPDGYHTATPYLIVDNCAAAIEFYQRALGAKEIFRFPGPGGKIAHCEIQVGDSRIMLADESRDWGTFSPRSLKGTPASIFLYVEDVDASYRKFVQAGGKEVVPVENMFWGDRFGKVADPFGHEWQIATHKEDLSPAEMEKRMGAMVAK